MEYEKITDDLSQGSMPSHIAIILDGNGRWAEKRGLNRVEGHREGSENLDRLIHFFLYLKVPVVSLYAFSTENWKRPISEINSLWSLMNEFFEKRLNFCRENKIKIKISGNISKLPKKSQDCVNDAVEATKNNKNLIANFCINYGSQDELLNACNQIVQDRIEAATAGKHRKAVAPVKKKSSKNIFIHTPFLPSIC